ncbi:acetylornithine/succinylornithine aminotransferase [Desulfitobacterium dichloroeliminans LMG P-21439]|uniref:Acetylornithine aminotransferase n=1 Tax=Desulfitobacterium dichloroeliminans (strain LMG P-21439 / DCA1) TaxID=871963 RepID=L0F592_DESDL|nr:aspartate aminotransferase family protein [Desulfitobacterium dichloroeliminans]AGA68098.1 acetylornithine/succinylornithine aminotransferase [Desulfitobacterium dichloroeliminans LMG P-21439]
MNETNAIVQRGQAVVMNTYGRLPMALVKGKGTYVWDAEGNKYLDFVTGLAVSSLGHSHPVVAEAIQKQAEEILHTSNLYWIPKQIALAEKLVENSFADKVFFCNSGAEANEAAIKLARKYAKEHYGKDKYEILTLVNSFHGRTLATLTATGQTKYQEGYAPLPEGFSYLPINDVVQLEEKMSEKVAAVMLEPIQGEGGILPVDVEFIERVRELCNQQGALLIFDEVQVGLGRTGKLFAYEWTGVTPDIMTLAKALGGGVPIGAMLATDRVASTFKPGDHASTFGGNPLSTAVGSAVMDILTEEGFMEDVQKRAQYFKHELQKLADKYHTGEGIRGQGFILGWPIDRLGPEIVEAARAKGLLINFAGGKALRFLPPLNVSIEEMNQAIAILDQIFSERW